MSELELFGGVAGAMEMMPEVYGDLAKPAVSSSGKVLSLLPDAVYAALAPLRKWIAHRNFSVLETQKLLEIKLANIDPKKVVSPDPYIAVPAFEAISYAMNSDELRNLYANLLSRAMNTDFKDAVHPSFVEIIKQLSPKDALELRHIFDDPENNDGIAGVCAQCYLGETTRYEQNVISAINTINDTATIFHSLSRNGLLQTMDTFYVDFDEVINSKSTGNERFGLANELIIRAQKVSPKPWRSVMQKSYMKISFLSLTSFGKVFYTICVEQ